MDAVYFRSPLLALAGLGLMLTAQPAAAQGIQTSPLPPAQGVAANPGAAKPAPSGDMAGRYIILREGGRDVGCMLTLEGAARGPGGDLKAQLAPACRDQGIVVFDPVAWRLERGRLVLTARKGHTATFEKQVDGAWWKDPAEGGKPLGVKKI